MASSRTHSLIGKELGVYRIEAALGSGGMGEVYRAVHQVLGKPVAIKTLKANVANDEGSLRRFRDEAKVVHKIGHENIVDIIDLAAEPGGLNYMVMELLDGMTLTDAIRQDGRMSPERTVRIAQQIASAMAAAHGVEVIHRDLKPDNVFLIRRAGSADYVKILDFGIARLKRSAGDATATASGVLIGTPAYMAPEQAAGERATPATDIYALGVILFQMLTGRLPFEGSSLPEIMYGHLKLQPPKVSQLSPSVPGPLTELIASALEKKPEDRPTSMSTMRESMLHAVGLDPNDFQIEGHPTESAAARPGENPADPQADSMWSGATMDATGLGPGLGEKPASQEIASDRAPADSSSASAGMATRGARPQALSATRTEHPGGRGRPADQSADRPDAGSRAGLSAEEAAAMGSMATMPPPESRSSAPLSMNTGPHTPAPSGPQDVARVVAIPTPEPSQPAVPADHARTRRKIILSVAAVIAVLLAALALVVMQRSSGERSAENKRADRATSSSAPGTEPDTTPDPPTPRARLASASREHDEPATPATCQSVDPDLLIRVADAAEALIGGSPGGARPGDEQVAADLARNAIDRAEYWYWLAKARLFANAPLEEVAATVMKTIDKCPDHAAAHDLLGTTRFRSGNAELAQAAYTRALTLDSEFVRARFNMALTQLALGRVGDGVSMLDQVIRERPDMAAARLARGQAYLELGDFNGAISDLEAATQALPESANGHFALGVAYERAKRPEDSARAMCRAANLGHENAAEFCR